MGGIPLVLEDGWLPPYFPLAPGHPPQQDYAALLLTNKNLCSIIRRWHATLRVCPFPHQHLHIARLLAVTSHPRPRKDSHATPHISSIGPSSTTGKISHLPATLRPPRSPHPTLAARSHLPPTCLGSRRPRSGHSGNNSGKETPMHHSRRLEPGTAKNRTTSPFSPPGNRFSPIVRQRYGKISGNIPGNTFAAACPSFPVVSERSRLYQTHHKSGS